MTLEAEIKHLRLKLAELKQRHDRLWEMDRKIIADLKAERDVAYPSINKEKGEKMRIQVEAVTKEPRIFNGQTQWGVKLPDGSWVTLYRERKPERGEEIDVNITERRGNNGQVYRDAFPVMPPLAQVPSPQEAVRGLVTPTQAPAPTQDSGLRTQDSKSNGKLAWSDYRRLVIAAHVLAKQLEPDAVLPDDGAREIVRVDRAPARIGLVNNIMRDVSKIEIPPEEQGPDADNSFPWEHP